MKKGIIIGLSALLVLALIVGSVFVWLRLQVDPTIVAKKFLSKIERQEFTGLEELFIDGEHPSEDELNEGFARFAKAFQLADIRILDLVPFSTSSKDATIYFELSYESLDLAPLNISSNLILQRSSIFEDWKVKWSDNLPLPNHGLAVDYIRNRIASERGNILNANGHLIAGLGSRVTVGVQPDRIKEEGILLEALERYLDLKPAYVRAQYTAPGVQGNWFVPLITLTEQEYSAVELYLRPVAGVFFRRIDARTYPKGDKYAHITGYLGEVTSEMIDVYPERDYVSGEIVGRAGIESTQDILLRGTPGYEVYVDPGDGSRTLLGVKPQVNPEDLQITIDDQMQTWAYELLQGISGSLVVLDAQSGAILVMASTPSYNPNEFIGGISSSRWRELNEDSGNPMFNRALQGLYPPGSIFKVVTVATAVDRGVYTPGSSFNDTGELKVEGNTIRNFERQVFGEHSLHEAMVHSVNTTVAQVGLELGAEILKEYFEAWGLNQSMNLGLPMVSSRSGDLGRSKVALAWSALGQDQVLLTPLHVARIFSVFANGGIAPPIHLLKNQVDTFGKFVLKPETVEQINSMLEDVVLTGTGKAARGTGLQVYAKTGTAEIKGGGNHAWFAGHVSLPDGHKIAFALLVENGGVGGEVAAPIMQKFLLRLKDRY
ncbi:MAG: penicillin-binding transpeptidase domain-containing protein [Bacillota bacterium]|nr:penicillin-binding transpeptidase domain-containing protein [Bacillota bacterium]